MASQLVDFSISDADAAGRANSHYDNDPLGAISPALLNSVDVIEYVRLTGMIFPFEATEQALKEAFKTASYEIPLVGEMHWIDDHRLYQSIELNTSASGKGDRSFTIRKNQIAFFSPLVTFRLPLYIAMRFNLHISHVHKGLLLGTGPLVDPGFQGRLLIPLHNLTANDYDLKAGEGLIWVEFTKISPNVRWDPRETARPRNDFVIKDKSKNLSAQDYFKKASGRLKPAESSIPAEIRQVERTAAKALWWSGGAAAGVVLAILAMLMSTWGLIADANKNVADASKNFTEANKAISDFRETSVVEMKSEQRRLAEENQALKRRLDDAESQLSAIRKRLGSSGGNNAK